MRRILRGQASFFSLTSARLSPRVTESSVDVKKDMEKSLKGSCEAFIMSVTKLTVEPLLSFITKVKPGGAGDRNQVLGFQGFRASRFQFRVLGW